MMTIGTSEQQGCAAMATQVMRNATACDTVVALPGARPGPGDAARRLDEHERAELNRLRWMVMKSRLAPKPDLERACFVLAGEPEASLERFAVAFFRGLAVHARRDMEFYRPAAQSVSPDETWLLRLVAAWRNGDDIGANALVAWRVRPEGRRWMRFLSAGLVNALDAGAY